MEEPPFKSGYRMPAEWSRHEGTWLAWPKNSDSFPGAILPKVEGAYLQIMAALHKNENVHLLVDDRACELRVKELLESHGVGEEGISMHRIGTVDVWFRDYGPIFIKKPGSKVAYTRWAFNAWGNKYDDLKLDAHVPDDMPLAGIKKFEAHMVLEGGSIDMNGMGSCLTSEQCLLNSNRNPQMDRAEIEVRLKDYLGATNVIWLKEGIAGDDTDGHVDDIARFVNENTVVCALEENTGDANYKALTENFNILKSAKDQNGGGLNVIPLPMPKPVMFNGLRLPASYTNFYIANKSVLVPIFGDSSDVKALGILKSLFPGREVIGINCRELVYGLGAIHCITQQQPSAD